MRATRRKLKLKQSELAALAGVSLETVVRYERCKQVSVTTDARIGEAILRMVMKKNPEAVKQAVQPMLEQAEKWEKIHSVEPGTELALELERLNGKSLAELKTHVEMVAGFLRRGANNFLSVIK
jgi:transcriptional regulator with XRE-family HTH domain